MAFSCSRRQFLKSAAAGAGALAFAAGPFAKAQSSGAAERPNVLWLTCEDTGPNLGCCGDPYAVTPNLDKLAAKGMLFTNVWSNAPVCAPARTTIITGMWTPALGAEHMRSQVRMPEPFKLYPQYLREAGYFCANNSKTDYNLAASDKEVWDECSGQAHWQHRKPGQPFFSIFNDTITHESQIRNAIDEKNRVHDPARAHVPAYHPDTPEVRKDWAQYYDRITMMDAAAGQKLRELEEAGLAEDTIVFFYGDHGSGMPRHKRNPMNSGLGVALIVYVPEKWKALAPAGYQAGASSDRLVGFYDLGPSLLSTCGVQPPAQMVGHAFMGRYATPEPEYVFGFRGRMDERYDLARSCRDKRYSYIRNFMPHKVYGQYVGFQFQTPTTRVWKKLFDEGKLNEVQARFWQTKPAEELYDLKNDPEETRNLAGSPEHQETLKRMRAALMDQLLAWRDVGFLSEGQIHARAGADAPWTMGQDDARYPMKKILAMADLASSLKPEATAQLVAGFGDADGAVRYWAVMGLLMRGKPAVSEAKETLRKAMADPSPDVRIIAAEALGRYGEAGDVQPALDLLVQHADLGKQDEYTALLAANSLQALVDKAAPVKDRIAALPDQGKNPPPRAGGYVARALEKLREDLGVKSAAPAAPAKQKKAGRGGRGKKNGKAKAPKA